MTEPSGGFANFVVATHGGRLSALRVNGPRAGARGGKIEKPKTVKRGQFATVQQGEKSLWHVRNEVGRSSHAAQNKR